MFRRIIILVVFGVVTVLSVGWATDLIIQGDSIAITYSNIYADTMKSADSVRARVQQGLNVDTVSLIEGSTGLYSITRKVDSTGMIYVSLDVFGWANDSDDTLVLMASYWAKDINVFKGAATADSGANTITFVFYDTLNDLIIPYLKHSVRNLPGTIDYGYKFANSLGVRNWSLDNGSYKITLSSTNYTQVNVPDTLMASGDMTDTIKIYPRTATDAHQSRLWSYISNKDGRTGREGVRLTFELPRTARYDDQLVYQFPETTYTDSSGYWTMDLIRSDSLFPKRNSYYMVTVVDTASNEQLAQYTFKVPDSASWKFDVWR